MVRPVALTDLRRTYACDSRATMTGIRANWATVSLTEPTSISANPYRR